MIKTVLYNAFAISALLLGLVSNPVQAQTHRIDYEQSKLSFSGTHAGNAFTGEFGEWSAKIEFFAERPENSAFEATFETKSAKTGKPLYDGTMPQKDWFNSKEFPEAHFETTKITSDDVAGHYQAEGLLTIRDITQPVSFDFIVSDPNTAPVRAEASLKLDRLAFGIGAQSDGNADWVSRDIDIVITIMAEPIGGN